MIRRQTPSSTKKAEESLMILRFSALGDILMTLPVVNALALKYPSLDIIYVSRPYVASLVELLPSNVHFKAIPHKTFKERIFISWIVRELLAMRPKAYADLHYVYRAKVVGLFLRLRGVKTCHIVKDRTERRRFLKKRPVVTRRRVFDCYTDVFEGLGYPVSVDPHFTLVPPAAERRGIGIAPFAAYESKQLPLATIEQLIDKLLADRPVYLFGSAAEKATLDSLALRHPGAVNMAGKLENLAQELRFVSSLEVMVSMDSANMHLASLAGTRVVSIWGATHPAGGYLGFGQSPDDCIQLDMNCRPCSIYGRTSCPYRDYPCLSGIKADDIYEKIIH